MYPSCKRMVAISIGMIVSLASGRDAPAGDLNPPARPVAPTMKTLSQVEPGTAVDARNTPGSTDPNANFAY